VSTVDVGALMTFPVSWSIGSKIEEATMTWEAWVDKCSVGTYFGKDGMTGARGLENIDSNV
jgi:hypothetical protein